MLTSITLNNFQAHKRLHLELRPGLNVITGPSDTGKSAIVRALRFMALHESASGLMTNGETDMSVAVGTAGGNRIVRFKSTKEYGYRLNDLEKFLACARDQPIPIATALNLTETNFQSQFDPHFLLSLTPGQVAKEINKIVALEDIDKALSWLKERLRSTNILLSATDSELNGVQGFLEASKHIPQLGDMLAALRTQSALLAEIEVEKLELAGLVAEIETLKAAYVWESRKMQAGDRALGACASLGTTKMLKQALESILAEAIDITTLPKLEASCAVLEDLVSSKTEKAGLLDLCSLLGQADFQISENKSKIISLFAAGDAKIAAQPVLSKKIRNLAAELIEVEHEITKHSNRVEELEQLLAKRAICSQCGRRL